MTTNVTLYLDSGESCESSTSVLGLKGVMYLGSSEPLPAMCLCLEPCLVFGSVLHFICCTLHLPPRIFEYGDVVWFAPTVLIGAFVLSLSPEFSTEYIV
jgi:hypothetical protein